jgi:hypothetical protein
MANDYAELYEQGQIQEALIDKQGEQQQKLYLPQLQQQMQENQAAVISQTDPRKDIRDLLNEFRGCEDVNGELKLVRDPLMNEVGLKIVSQILRPLMVNTVRFTRLTNKTIKNFTLQIVDDLTYDIGENWREYDIRDRSACDHIINAIAILVFAMLSRAEDQNEKNWAGKMVFENLSPPRINKKESSWLEKFKLGS